MSRDPIAALIKLAGLEVDRARADHARAQAAVNRVVVSIQGLQDLIADESDHRELQTGAAMGLANQGLEALHRSLKREKSTQTELEEISSRTLSELNQAILADERYAIYQARLHAEQKRIRDRREIEALDDLHLARIGSINTDW